MKFFNLSSIRQRLTLLILFAVLPCFAILLYSGIEMRLHLIEDAKSNVLLITHNMAEAQKKITQSTKQSLTILSQLSSIQAMDPNACSIILKNVVEQNPNIYNIALVDLSGEILASGKPFTRTNLADRKHVKEALEKHDFAVGQYIVTRIGAATPAFAFAYPVLDKEGRIKAVLNAAIRLDNLSHFYDVSTLPEKSFVAVTDYKGTRLLYYPAQHKTNPIGKPIKAGAWNIATKGEEHGIFLGSGSDGMRRIFAYEKVRLNNEDTPYVYVWAGIPEAQAHEAANASLVRNLLILFLCTVISIFISWKISKNILISPIQSLVGLTRKLAQGNFKAYDELTAQAGELGVLTKAFQDMAESLKMNRRTLKESEGKYRSMMEAMIDPTYICSNDFRIEYMNPAMVSKIGHDATGDLCYKVIYDKDEKCSWCTFDQIVQGKHIIYENKDPKTGRFYSVNCSPVLHSDAPASMLSIFRDITEIKMMEKERIAAETKLQQAMKMESIGTLAGGIAHDFNNILSSIIGFSELALGGAEKGTELEDDLQEVRTAGLRAKDLVKQILTFARQSDEEVKPIQINVITKEVLKFITSSIPSTVKINSKINSDSFIMGSPTQVHQILMNLCTNAAHAMEEKGGILEININDIAIDKKSIPNLKTGEYIELKVIDTGKGISQKNLCNIFEPYFTTKPVGEGTGLGLAVVHGIVEKYGGKIIVDSKINKGTCFTIYFPITKKRKLYSHSENEEIPIGNENILFVDDEAPIAKMGSKVLEQLGYSVTIRTSSIEALELFKSKPQAFDLVISDMTMPNMTGDNLAVELMKIRPDISVILCTGYSKKISEESAKEIGIKAFAYKPIVKYDLAKTIRNVLDEANDY